MRATQKILDAAKESAKTLKSGKMKNEKHKKSLNIKMTMKFFTFIFYNRKEYILFKNKVWENKVYTMKFLVKLFLVLQDI